MLVDPVVLVAPVVLVRPAELAGSVVLVHPRCWATLHIMGPVISLPIGAIVIALVRRATQYSLEKLVAFRRRV